MARIELAQDASTSGARMSRSPKIALLVDPFTMLARGGHHARGWARAAIRAGYTVQSFGAPAAHLPSSPGLTTEEARAGVDRGAGVAAFDPDWIVAYDALSPAAWLGARCARRLDRPLVLVEPGSYVPGSLFERTLWRLGETLWGRTVRRQMNALVALDPTAAAHAAVQGFDPDQIEVVEPGVDLDLFRPGLSSPLIGRHGVTGRVLLYVGRVIENRGLETLLRAFTETLGRGAGWSLVIAGAGDLHGRLRALSEQRGVSAALHLLPKVDDQQLPALFSSATLVAVPSPSNAVRGIALLRAMASGRGVLTSSAVRLAHLVEHGRQGLVVEPGDDDLGAWIAALRQAAIAPESRRRWGNEGRALAEERLAWPRVLTAFGAVFDRAGERHRERRAGERVAG